MQFIIEIPLAILDQYNDKWKAVLSKFEASHPIAFTDELDEGQKTTAGVRGLERLCQIYGTASWVEHRLKSWDQEVFS